jgi:glycine/D-amino acid oxidase-like deaminating enzyme
MGDGSRDQLAAFAGDPEQPPRTSVVVVGGGIVGVATAFFLAEAGVPVVLAEKGRIGAEQSGRNWGWCRVMGRDPRELPIGLESLRLWRDMNRLTGRETGFREAGTMYLLDSEAEIAEQSAWLEGARDFQVQSRLLTGAELMALLPGAGRPFRAGLHTPTDGRAEPARATVAIAEAARDRGATILTGCAVRGIETAAGRVSGVVTERGRIACDTVVLAGGAWSRLFAGNAGIDIPQLKVLGAVLRTRPIAGLPEVAVGGKDFAFRKRLDGGYTVARRNANVTTLTADHFRLFADFLPAFAKSWRELRLRVGRATLEDWRVPRRWALDQESPFERVRVLDPEPPEAIVAEAKRNLAAAFPAFARLEEAERWGGMIDATPDAVPIISPVAELPGFVVATGFSGHGFGIGPGAGRLAADLATGRTPIVDPAPFALDRFPRGRKVQRRAA